MKILNVFRTATVTAVLFFGSHAKAQDLSLHNSEALVKASTTLENTSAVADPDEIVLDGLKLRSEKIYQHFTRNFKGANSISVYPGEQSTVVYCQVKGIRTNILYTNKGYIQHSIRYYDAELLPQNVSKMLSDDFPDYKLNGVIEINAEGQTAYLVNLESINKYKIVRVLNGSWDVYQEFEKQR